MATSKENPQAQNLAAILLIKRKIAAKNENQSGTQPPQPTAVTGAHSNEKITYRQQLPVINPQETATATPPANTTEQPKISRKTKQLEVNLLDEKMEEINRKQETQTSQALDTWKGFDDLNYGFNSDPGTQKSTPVPPVSKKTRTPTPSPPPKKQPSPVKTVTEPPRQKSPVKQQSAKKHRSPTPRTPSPKRVDSPVKHQPRTKSPPKEEEPRNETPPPQKTVQKQPTPPPSPKQKKVEKRRSPSPPPRQKSIERQPSPPPPPPPRRSKLHSALSFEKTKSPEQELSKSEPLTPIIENRIPISSIISNPQISERHVQRFEQPTSPISTAPHFKLFPDIKHYEIKRPRNAYKSIQRSMDRYRFHVW